MVKSTVNEGVIKKKINKICNLSMIQDFVKVKS